MNTKTIDIMRQTLITAHLEDARMFRRAGRPELICLALRNAKWCKTAPAREIRRAYRAECAPA